jgi:hypothetical protein
VHGVLSKPEQQKRSWFYVRRPLPYDTMPLEIAARYSEAHSGEAEAADNATKLEARRTGERQE